MTKGSELKIASVQMNSIPGDVPANTKSIVKAICKYREASFDLILFPELALSGYYLRDQYFNSSLWKQIEDSLAQIKAESDGIAVLVGHPALEGGRLYNRVSLVIDGAIRWSYDKQKLPNYGVFDEKRYFVPGGGDSRMIFEFRLAPCEAAEDLWHNDIREAIASQSPDLVLSINASPFDRRKDELRRQTLLKAWKCIGSPVIYLNCVGGQDHLMFDGRSLIVDHQGNIMQMASHTGEDIAEVSVTRKENSQPVVHLHRVHEPLENSTEVLVQTLCLVCASLFIQWGELGRPGAWVELIPCVAALAVEALGVDNVSVLTFPSRYTSKETVKLSQEFCENLGLRAREVSIEPAYDLLKKACTRESADSQSGKAEVSIAAQNIQARLRGLILMSHANEHGSFLLATGNKSELAMGYCTLYGDMCGALAPIGDLSKTEVYEVAEWFAQNRGGFRGYHQACPTAELAPDQADSLPLPAVGSRESLYRDPAEEAMESSR